VTLNGFMAYPSLAGARASTRPSAIVEHYVLALLLFFVLSPHDCEGQKADARADRAPENKAQEEHHRSVFFR
jgi:hypothetical protein